MLRTIRLRRSELPRFARLVLGWPRDPAAYPLLLGRLKAATDPNEKANLAWSLGGLGTPPDECLGPLLDALATGDWILRQTVPTALGKLGSAAIPALQALEPIARDELADPSVPLSAARAIVAISPGSPEAQGAHRALGRHHSQPGRTRPGRRMWHGCSPDMARRAPLRSLRCARRSRAACRNMLRSQPRMRSRRWKKPFRQGRCLRSDQ